MNASQPVCRSGASPSNCKHAARETWQSTRADTHPQPRAFGPRFQMAEAGLVDVVREEAPLPPEHGGADGCACACVRVGVQGVKRACIERIT